MDFGFYNLDCMEGMKQFPDKYFDLAIVDPPYGNGGASSLEQTSNGSEECSTSTAMIPRGVARQAEISPRADRYDSTAETGGTSISRTGEICKKIIAWDIAPEQDYFNELFRVSRNQIIWGAITLTFHRQDVF